MVPDGYKNSQPSWDGVDRRMTNEPGQIHSAITEIKVMTARFDALEKTLAAFMSEMKDYQVKTAHQARQDYEYLDTKIDRKNAETAEAARAALKKVEDHILLSEKETAMKKGAVDWVRWAPGIIFGGVAMVIAIINFWGK